MFDDEKRPESLPSVVEELNNRVYDLLELDDSERALIHDFVNVRMHLIQGKVGRLAVAPPSTPELTKYAFLLKCELDGFMDDPGHRHDVAVVHDDCSGMIQIELAEAENPAESVLVLRADAPAAKEFEKTRRRLRQKHSQWLYFERNLRVFEENRTYLFKPLQRLHWTRSQALVDADEIIADILST